MTPLIFQYFPEGFGTGPHLSQNDPKGNFMGQVLAPIGKMRVQMKPIEITLIV